MTDRLKGVVVSFDADVRSDDAKYIVDAILMIKGVASVTSELVDATDYMNRSRVRMDLEQKLLKVLRE